MSYDGPDRRYNGERRARQWTHGHTIVASSLGILVSALTILSLLGVLPWATKSELDGHKAEDDRHFVRIEKEVDDIHGLFFPEKHRGDGR